MELNSAFWVGRRVFVTGHTGFKGGWLCLWLQALGAKVHGFALAPDTEPSVFTAARVDAAMATHVLADVRDASDLHAAMEAARPEVVFHLAAQPLVQASYAQPLQTYAVNVMGTAHLLEAARTIPSVKAVVVVTTDKCYENREWVWGYRESDPMGGDDPYSSSKGCAELVTAAYRRSFLEALGIHVATARAGNVIGGGDGSPDRLIPDCLRALDAHEPLTLRSPTATRPWQHVLECLSGYLLLAQALHCHGSAFADAWNFGPRDSDARPVRWIVETLAGWRPDLQWDIAAGEQPHEANMLKLDISKASARLGWQPRWPLELALRKTLAWHEAWRGGKDMRSVSLEQIRAFRESAHSL